MAEPEDPIVTESILSFERQFSLRKLSINRDTWTTHKSAQRFKGKKILADNKEINEVLRANNLLIIMVSNPTFLSHSPSSDCSHV